MNLHEVLTESNQTISEKPMGFIKQGLTKLGAKVLPGSFGAKMQGKLDTGNVANTLYKDFATYLGRSGQKATDDSVRAFLQSKGADKEIDIEKIIGSNISETVALSRSALNKIFMQVAQGLAGSTAHSLGATSGSTPQSATSAAPSAPPGTVPSASPGVTTAQPAGTQPGGLPQPKVKKVKSPAVQPAATAQPAGTQTPVKKTRAAVKKPAVQTPTQPTATAQPAPAAAGVNLDPKSGGGFKTAIPPQASGFKRDVSNLQQQPAAPAQTKPAVAAKKTRSKKVNPKAAVPPTATSGQAKGNFGQVPSFGQTLPSYTESILKKITVASVSGIPVTRELYNAANKLMLENNTTLKEMGIKVNLKESTRNTVKLSKI